jgi:hypothetical protein
MANAYRTAERPYRGRLPPAADAICFRDWGELLASLALDLRAGHVAHRWWWSALGEELPLPAALAPALVQHAFYVPAAFDYLMGWGGVASVLRGLSETEAWEVWEAVARAHGVPALAPEIVTRTRVAAGEGSQERESSSGASPLPPTVGSVIEEPVAVTTLPGLHRALCGVALALQRQPARTRLPVFATAFAGWWHENLKSAPHGRRDKPPVVVVSPDPAQEEEEEAGSRDEGIRGLQGEGEAERRVTFLEESHLERPTEGESVEVTSATVVTAPVAREAEASASYPGEVPGATRQRVKPVRQGMEGRWDRGPSEPASPPVSVLPPAPALDGVATRCAGVFYLINVLRWLNLPGCFDDAPGPWETLELVGRGLVGGAAADDPLWGMLAELAGRPVGVLPGEDVTLNDTFLLPGSWLAEAGREATARLEWAVVEGRLVVWSDPGFLVAEGPWEPGTSASDALAALVGQALPQAVRPVLVRRRAGAAPLRGPALSQVPGVSTGGRLWLARLLPALRYLLWGVLELEPDDEIEDLLTVPGRLHVSATHVDVVIRLDDISLPIRRAGLDRDPGWLPEFGRIVLFHFE